MLATAGLYEHSGEWLYEVGLPGKSGLATFSPPLDDAGNSVRGQLATRFLTDLLGLNLFPSAPPTPPA